MMIRYTLTLLMALSLQACPPPQPDPEPQNRPPTVSPVTLETEGTLPYIEQALPASDPDGDAITYEMLSPQEGPGYQEAILVPLTGRLYLTLKQGYIGPISIEYRATDGMLFSQTAAVSINVVSDQPNDNGTGSETVDPRTYAGYDVEYYDTVLVTNEGGEARRPRRVDLSSFFPIPGNQGQLGSCVGWSTAYALKSYQERLETGLDFNSPSRVFSPSYVFSQIALPGCNGSYISDALELMVQQGCSSWQSMPYAEVCGGDLPSQAARTEAGNFRASRWFRLNSVQEAKDAITNRKPVVVGIPIHQNFYTLSGPDSVYNTLVGNNDGGHAVCITGFDDDRFGGAFKVINSWGTQWGAGGYFWLPYDFAAQIINQMYVMDDNVNLGGTIDPGPVLPVTEDLPNLQVQDWNADYDEQSGGAGVLTYRVVNTGTGTAAAGFDINFMLSTDTTISSEDLYLLYEEAPTALAPGEAVARTEADGIEFNFPTSLPNGTYYLALWVDDLQEVQESNEDDNVSFAANTVTFASDSADLIIDNWYAYWDDNGDGGLEYIVRNQGDAPLPTPNWDINLILSPDLEVGNDNDWFLLNEVAGVVLGPGEVAYRDQTDPAPFNVVTQWNGELVEPGTYYMALWVDFFQQVPESNEENNASFGNGVLEITGKKSAAGPAVQAGKAYNGRVLPTSQMFVKKVEVTRNKSGNTEMRVIEDVATPQDARETLNIRQKTNGALDKVVFPVVEEHSMP